MAEKVTLYPYPFPEGMVIPRLMPYQEYPWNADGYLAAEVLRLKEAHGLMFAIETGTCLGSTAIWMRDNFSAVDTVEVNLDFAVIASARIGDGDTCKVAIGNSVDYIGDYLNINIGGGIFIFLDAHWSKYCPLLDELSAIAKAGVKPCIIIHDFQVPGTDFGFDSMPDGRPFNLDLIRSHIDAIYGVGGWKHNYPTKVEGARRGWISVEPA
jgi:hypothetical protein